MADYDLNNTDISAQRYAPVVVPARAALRALLRPVLTREGDLLRGLAAEIDELRQRVAQLETRCEALARAADEQAPRLRAVETATQATAERTSRAAAESWDAVAMARRLSAIEDRLAASGR
jgi:hypothetical protein